MLPPLHAVALPHSQAAGDSLGSLPHSSSCDSITPHTPAGDDSSPAGLVHVTSDLEIVGSAGAESSGSGGRLAFVTLLTRCAVVDVACSWLLPPHTACLCQPAAEPVGPVALQLCPCPLPCLVCRDSYLPGVQALARSLAAVRTAYPLLVMYTADTLPPSAVAALQREPVCEPLAVERYLPPGGFLGRWN